jgi:hypothetical protein
MTVSEPVTAAVRVDGGPEKRVVIGGDEPQTSRSTVPTNCVVDLPSKNAAGVAKATLLTDAPTGATLTIRINDTLVFTGTVEKSEPGIGNRRRVTAFDTVHQLKQTFLNVTFDNAEPARAIAEVAGKTDVDVAFEPPPERPGRITQSFNDSRADVVIDELTKKTDAVTRVSPDGTLLVARPNQLQRETHLLSRIIDATAGSRRPQYESVQVVGNTSISDSENDVGGELRQQRHLISAQPIIAEAGDGQPTFLFKDNSIQTQRQANNVAGQLLRRLQKQQQGGQTTIVGRPDIRPLDRVTIPESQGGGTFLVSNIEHTISATDGFQSRLSLGGTIGDI